MQQLWRAAAARRTDGLRQRATKVHAHASRRPLSLLALEFLIFCFPANFEKAFIPLARSSSTVLRAQHAQPQQTLSILLQTSEFSHDGMQLQQQQQGVRDHSSGTEMQVS